MKTHMSGHGWLKTQQKYMGNPGSHFLTWYALTEGRGVPLTRQWFNYGFSETEHVIHKLIVDGRWHVSNHRWVGVSANQPTKTGHPNQHNQNFDKSWFKGFKITHI